MKLARHLLAVAVLPFSVAVLISLWLARTNDISPAIGTGAAEVLLQGVGLLILAVGLILFDPVFRVAAEFRH